jgi:hypothetical protein
MSAATDLTTNCLNHSPEDFFSDIPVPGDAVRVDPLIGAEPDSRILPSDDFIRDYIRYADRYETPTVVHEAIAMSVIAMAANGKVFIDTGEIQIPLDLWVYIISASGTGKNTTTSPAHTIIQGAGLNRLLHNESFGSASQVEQYFAEHPQGWLVNTEMGQFLAKFSQNQFQGALEWITNLYDEIRVPANKNYRKRATVEEQTPAIIFKTAPRVCLLGMSSRSWFLRYTDRSKATGGFLPRWIPVIADADDTERIVPRVRKADPSLIPPLVERLKLISRLEGAMDISDVTTLYDTWYIETSKRFKALPDQELVQPFWHRHRSHLWKIAAVYELATTGQMKLTEEAMRRAIQTCRVLEKNIQELTASNFSEDSLKLEKIVEHVYKAGIKGLTRRDVFEHMNETRRDVAENRIVMLLQRERIFAFKKPTKGRPAKLLIHADFISEYLNAKPEDVFSIEWRDFIS